MLYIMQGDDHSIIISAYHPDNELFENNNWELTDNHSHLFSSSHRLPAQSLLNCIGNILKDAGIDFEEL